MIDEIIFRRAEISDISQFSELRQSQLIEEGEGDAANITEQIKEYLYEYIPNDTFAAYIALHNKKIIATGGITFYRLPPWFCNPTGLTGQIGSIYTIPEYRRMGIANKILDNIINEAKERECKLIRVTASEDGKLLYQNYGFKIKNNFMQYIIE